MSIVVIKGCEEYQPALVYKSLKEGLGLIGGISSYIKEKEKVLIKPNIVVGSPVEQAANTHPVVVEAIARLVIEAGAIPIIGDSPMFDIASNASKKIGYDKVAENLKIKIIDFINPQRYEFRDGKIFKNFEIEKSIMEADKIINVAKLKTHTQMYMTLCVKNMFGSIVGKEKAKWHYIAGRSYDIFAKILLELYCFTKPVLNIIDGIVGMEGYGPVTGLPRKIGILVFGSDGVAVDRVACEVVGADPIKIPIFKANEELNVGASRLEDIKIIGDDILGFKITDFKFPQLEPVNAGPLPVFVKRIIKNRITSRPGIIKKKCKKCKMCIGVCPTEAIGLLRNNIKITYENCIRCYCCIEACEHGAIIVKTPLLAKLTR